MLTLLLQSDLVFCQLFIGTPTKLSRGGLTVRQLLSKEEEMRSVARGQALNAASTPSPKVCFLNGQEYGVVSPIYRPLTERKKVTIGSISNWIDLAKQGSNKGLSCLRPSRLCIPGA